MEYGKIERNTALRFIAKLMPNFFWGKLAQKPNKSQTATLDTFYDYWVLLNDEEKEIMGEYMATENMMIVSWKLKHAGSASPGKSSSAIAALVTAYGKVELYRMIHSFWRDFKCR